MKELFALWHDRLLHARTRRGLEAHLAACPPCRVYFESLEVTIGLVREWPGVEVPGEVSGHLHTLLRARHERSPRGGCGCAAGKRAAGRTAAKRPAAKKPATKKPAAKKPARRA